MANLKRKAINVSAAILAVLFVVGVFNVGAIIDLVEYAQAHVTTPIGMFFVAAGLVNFFFFPIIASTAIENWMWRSNTTIGVALSNAAHNARNNADSFVALGICGGVVLFFAVWGAVTIIA